MIRKIHDKPAQQQ
jgi:hypothetical protein